MNRINQLFKQKDKNLLSLYFCAGAPAGTGIADTLVAMEQAGIDFAEIGIPFSDPLADGPVIQQAATEALRNGMTLRLLFKQLQDIRARVSMPLILMGYLNPILQYGFETFCRSCQTAGIDGCIIPDLPFHEYLSTYKDIAHRYDIRLIMLITPETDEERIRLIDAHTDGFIYMVSSAATTGAQDSFHRQEAYFRRVEAMHLKNPRMIGFGISNRATLEAAQRNASGAIVGSRFVALLSETGDPAEALRRLKEDLS